MSRFDDRKYRVILLATDGMTHIEESAYENRKFAETNARELSEYWASDVIFENGMRAQCVLLLGPRTHLVYPLTRSTTA
jgi:hypothetical protein